MDEPFEHLLSRSTRGLLPVGLGSAAVAVLVSLGGPTADGAVASVFFVLSVVALAGWFTGIGRMRNASVPDRVRWALAAALGLASVSLVGGALLDGPVGLLPAVGSLVLLGVGGAFFSAALWVLVHDLAVVRQGKAARRNYALLAGLAVLGAVARSPGAQHSPFGRLSDGLVLATVVVAVVLGFRQSWVHYLTRRQKLAAFWATLFTVVLCALASGDTGAWTIFENAAPFRSAVGISATMGAIYFGMASFALLLSLPAARAYDRRSKGLASLQRLSELVSSIFDVDELIRTIPKLAVEVTEGDAAWLELRRNGRLRVVSSIRVPAEQLEGRLVDLEQGVSGWILRTGRTILSQQLQKDARVHDLQNVQPRWRSVIGVPVAAHDRRLGVLYVARYEAFGFEPDDCELLQAFANQSAVALENASLIRESIEKQRLEEELRVAREAQRKLLPTEPLHFKGVTFDGLCVMANNVGGDYFDYFPIDENRVATVIADVAGKGASAAFYMAETKGVVETLSRLVERPSELLVRANEVLSHRMDRKTFISLIYAVVDVSERKVSFARAGHCPLAHVMRDGTVRFLEPKGVGIGLLRSPRYAELVEDLEFSVLPGESVFLFTDGLTEAMSASGEEFGEGRVSQVLSRLREAGVPEMKQGIVRGVEDFVGPGAVRHDDLTFVIIRFEEDTSANT